MVVFFLFVFLVFVAVVAGFGGGRFGSCRFGKGSVRMREGNLMDWRTGRLLGGVEVLDGYVGGCVDELRRYVTEIVSSV
jgi:hypothetical protein